MHYIEQTLSAHLVSLRNIPRGAILRYPGISQVQDGRLSLAPHQARPVCRELRDILIETGLEVTVTNFITEHNQTLACLRQAINQVGSYRHWSDKFINPEWRNPVDVRELVEGNYWYPPKETRIHHLAALKYYGSLNKMIEGINLALCETSYFRP